MEFFPLLIAALLVALFTVVTVVRTVRIVPQARARNVERLGRYQRTLTPGLNFVIPYVDRVYPRIDLREQVVSFSPQPVITEDNLVVEIDTVLYFQVTDRARPPTRSPATCRPSSSSPSRRCATWSARWTWSAPSPPATASTASCAPCSTTPPASGGCGSTGWRSRRSTRRPHQGRDGEADARRAGQARRDPGRRGTAPVPGTHRRGRQAGRDPARRGCRTAAILKAEGQAHEIDEVFRAVHRNDPDPKLLAYQYLQVLPQLAQGEDNTFSVIPTRSPPRCRASPGRSRRSCPRSRRVPSHRPRRPPPTRPGRRPRAAAAAAAEAVPTPPSPTASASHRPGLLVQRCRAHAQRRTLQPGTGS